MDGRWSRGGFRGPLIIDIRREGMIRSGFGGRSDGTIMLVLAWVGEYHLATGVAKVLEGLDFESECWVVRSGI